MLRALVRDEQRVLIQERGEAAQERELAARELVMPVLREFRDELFLSLLDGFHVHADRLRIQAELSRAFDIVPAMRRLEQRLRRHAAVQDTEPADLRAALDNDRLGHKPGRRARRGITGAAAANDGDIELGLHGLVLGPIVDDIFARRGLRQ